MRKYFYGLLLTVGLLSFIKNASAQTVEHLTSKDFTDKGELMLFLKGGWEYKKQGGNNWQKINPLQLGDSIANEKGEVDGWLRFYFTVDSTIGSEPLFIRFTYFGASSVFINGQLVHNQSENSLIKAHEYKPVKINAQQKHCLLMRIKDEKKGFPINSFQQDLNPYKLGTVRFVNIMYQRFLENRVSKIFFFYNLWIISVAIFSILFGILYFVNKRNSNLLYITLSNTLLCLAIYLIYRINMTDISVPDYIRSLYMSRVVLWLFILVLVITIFKLIGVHFTKIIKVLLLLMVFVCIVQAFIDNNNLGLVIFLFVLLFITYHVTQQIKYIKGAQWFVVAGIVAVIFFAIMFNVITGIIAIDSNSNISLFTGTGITLSFPISLFFYLAFRFREINQEVVDNADKVVRLSEEKRIQAENQQKVLEEEVEKQTVELRNSLQELKSTQSQLVQSEKMASLGELTAGIAHEIQNPLNFVNNFSELNVELSKELQDLMRSLGPATAERSRSDAGLEMTALIDDISSNSEKINHHGKRASDIVKGMLQHSRTSTGQKEPMDINALCDEYLRLAYHGLRAKDKTFNAQFETHFDENLPKVNIVPQDMGRVVLNIINNAFFAVAKQSEIFNLKSEKYEPRVIVRTKLSPRDGELVSQSESQKKIIIEIEDNGGGIPADIKEKIFQPFFTTKPTGQGTGLGLSLAYDIVTKVHGGKLTVESELGKGTIFKIEIPA